MIRTLLSPEPLQQKGFRALPDNLYPVTGHPTRTIFDLQIIFELHAQPVTQVNSQELFQLVCVMGRMLVGGEQQKFRVKPPPPHYIK